MKLKIGYVSPDFHTHSVAYFIEPLLKAHNKEEFELFGYYNNSKTDGTSVRLREYFDGWQEVDALSDIALADKIYEDQIDILVDLAGHSANNRLGVLARKPAPIQATWLGYPNTSGLSAVDYRITDVIADPIGESDALNTEKLIRLDDGFLCYQGDSALPVADHIPYDKNGYFTFGSFNNFAKVTSEVIEAWAKILHSVPNAKLIMKSYQLADQSARRNCLSLFEAQGIVSERLIMTGMLANSADHMAYYGEVDLALDPFPYNGTTTTFEALWMGVPTLTYSGNVHACRVGASIVSRIGLEDYVAYSPEDYIALAVKKSSSLNELRQLRRSLRSRMLSSKLCDSAAFAHQIETAYQNMWRVYCQN
jgi:predicted O-linked N-acetylglucosamine transferase (SPINDLY family)